MIASRLKGDDLARAVVDAHEVGVESTRAANRRSAFGARREWSTQIKQRFSTAGRVWAAKGWASAINVRKNSPDWYTVADKATYKKKRTDLVSLGWVFDNAPTIRGKRGWVAVPIRGQAPLASSGRRYAWPSEAAAMGWQLEVVNVMGKPLKLIMGRRGREPWRALYFYIPPYKAAKRLDLDGLHAKYEALLERHWGEEFDKRIAKRHQRLAA